MTSQKPVFYDPERKRWRRLRALLDALGVFIGIVIVVFVISTVRGENLPNILLPEPNRGYHAMKDKEKGPPRVVAKKAPAKSKTKKAVANATVGINGDGPRAAFYVEWDAGSYSSLKQYYPQIDLLFPEWLHVLTPDGNIQGVTSENKLFDVVQSGKVRSPDNRNIMQFLKAANAQTEVIPLVNNVHPITNQWLENIGTFLNDANARAHFREQADLLMSSQDYHGLSIDFEEIPLAAQPGFKAFVNEMYSDFHPRGLKLYLNVPVDDKDFDYKYLAAHSDALILMDYDQHQITSDAGPVAGQDWFARNLRVALKDIPKDKVMLAVGNYGYDWSTSLGKKNKIVNVDTLSAQEAWLHAKESDVSVQFDPASLNPHYSFMEEDNLRHDVWFLDAVSALNQMRAANQLGIDSFALWRLGSEDRSLWAIWDSPSLEEAPGKLREMLPGYDVDFEGKGEVMRIEHTPSNGEREVGAVDPATGMVTNETFKSLPNPYQLAEYGFKAKQVAITFDDGPDPTWTPLILDELKKADVKATFFLIGVQADKFDSLTRRIYNEGHEIGNHTFTHPDAENIGRRYMEVELNLTERYLTSELGVKPLFFRPPYAVDEEPDTADQVRPLEVVQSRGYITVGEKIDPNDWHDNPHPSPEEITEKVMENIDLPVSDPHKGSILLLHDGGGDRSNTVKALPMIIAGLRQRGYDIVPVSELIGKTRAEVMPPISSNEQLAARIDGVGFTLLRLVGQLIVLVFFVGDFLMTGRLLFVGFSAIADRVFTKLPENLPAAKDYRPSVAVIIPAYNEEKVIARTIRSILMSDYPNVRAIVVDDGSKDNTYEIAKNTYAKEIAEGRLTVLTKPNGGKAAAANFALQHVTEELFVAIDADTVISKRAISFLVPNFSDPKVGAVAGNAKVGNRVNIWTRWQALEYITSQNFERRALNLIDAVTVVPGAIGAWRTSAVREAGLYPVDTVAEDADLTMSLLEIGYKVRYEDRALAYTEAPMNANGLMRQRFRWSFGILQAAWKHRSAFLHANKLGWIALPNILIFQMLLPLVSPLIDVMFIVGAGWYAIQRYWHPETANSTDFKKLVLFFAIFLIIDFMASTVAFLLERKEGRSPLDKWLLSQVWLQRLAYRQLFSLVLAKTIKRAFDGRPFAWDKLERTAALTHAGATRSN